MKLNVIGLLFGVAFKRYHWAYAVPAIAVIPTDLAEGAVQVAALLGNDQVLWLKSIVTPAKLVLFIAAVMIAIAAIIGQMRGRPARKR